MPGFSYPRTIANTPILDFSIRSELQRNIEHLERTLFEPKMSLETRFRQDDSYTALFDWEKARENKENYDSISVVYHPEPRVHMDVVKEKYWPKTRKHERVTKIRIFRPPGISSDTLTEIILNWTGREGKRASRMRVPLP